MDSSCYGRVLGTELGPMSYSDLKHMALVGELSQDDEIKIGNDGQWVLAKLHPELFDAETVPSTTESNVTPQSGNAQRYYCQLFGSELGPLDFADLQQMVVNGELSQSDTVRLETEDRWCSAQEIEGLFAAQAAVNPQAEEWYCQVLGSELGPLELTDLITMIQNGELSEQDFVRCGLEQEWRAAGEVELLQCELMSQEAAVKTDTNLPATDATGAEDDFQLKENTDAAKSDPDATNQEEADYVTDEVEHLSESESNVGAIESEQSISDGLLDDIEDMLTDDEVEDNTAEEKLENSSAEGWFVLGAGNVEIGPMSLEQLQSMIDKKQVQAHQKIKSGRSGDWMVSSELDTFLKSLNITDQLKPAANTVPTSAEKNAEKPTRPKRNFLAPFSDTWTNLKSRLPSFRSTTQSVQERTNYFYANPVLLVVLVIAAGVWALQFVSFEVSAEAYLARLNEIYNQTRSLKEQSGTPEQWDRLISKAEALADEIDAGLGKHATAEHPAKITVLRAARDHLVPMVKATRNNKKQDILLFERQLREARAHLDGDRAYFERQAKLSEVGQ